MRNELLLQKIRELTAQGSFSGHFESDYVNNSRYYRVKRLPQLRDKLEFALQLPVLSKIAEDIFRAPPLRMVFAEVDVSNHVYSKLQEHAYSLDASVGAMGELLAVIVGTTVIEQTVSIKFKQASNLADVNRQLDRLDQTLTQALSVLPEVPSLSVSRWENGSLWIDLLIGSVAGVVLIGGITSVAASAYKKWQEGVLIRKTSESLGIKNEVLKSLNDQISFAIETLIQAEAKRLDEKHSKKGDPETIQRLQYAIRQIFEMIKEGTEVHPALMAPENVKNAFPDMADILGLPSSQKLLKDHSESSEESADR